MGQRISTTTCRDDPFRQGCLFLPGCFFLVAAALSGCFATTRTSPYPPDWPLAKTIGSETCPVIAGRYLNAGTPSQGLGASMGFFCSQGRRSSWSCDYALATNLLVNDPAFRLAQAIEIQQPDSNTLSISVPDDASVQPRTLSRSHLDFHCDASGLTISSTGSVMNPLSSAVGLLALTGGVASSSRTFRPANDGSLIMDVTNESFFVHGFVGGTLKGQGFVLWNRDTRGNSGGQATPKKAEEQ
jgi:hypothetical protein